VDRHETDPMDMGDTYEFSLIPYDIHSANYFQHNYQTYKFTRFKNYDGVKEDMYLYSPLPTFITIDPDTGLIRVDTNTAKALGPHYFYASIATHIPDDVF